MSIYDKQAPQGLFIRFQGGDTHRLRMFGEAIDFEKAFVLNGVKQPPKQRFASLCLFRNMATATSEVKIVEFGWGIQSQLATLAKDDEWGDPTEYDIKISATGEGLNRDYKVVPIPKKPVSEADQKLIKGCSIDLSAECNKSGTATKSTGAQAEYDPTEPDDFDPFA